jgi:hypothetical protein
LSTAADALTTLPLEELATGQFEVMTRPLPKTLHTLKIANAIADFRSGVLEFFNLPGLRRLTLRTPGSHLRLRDLSAAEQLEILRLRGFTIYCEEPQDPDHFNIRVRFPVNVRIVSLENCRLLSGSGARRLPGLYLTGNSLLESFTYTRVPDARSFPATMLRLAPAVLDLSIGPVALTTTTFQHMDLRGSHVRRLALELSSAEGILPLNPPQAVPSVTRLTLTGLSLSIRWLDYLATALPEVRDCELNIVTCEPLSPFTEFACLLGRLRTLKLHVSLATTQLESLLEATGPDLRELCVLGSLIEGRLEDLVMPEQVMARLTALQLGTRVFWQPATRVVPEDFITKQIDVTFGH